MYQTINPSVLFTISKPASSRQGIDANNVTINGGLGNSWFYVKPHVISFKDGGNKTITVNNLPTWAVGGYVKMYNANGTFFACYLITGASVSFNYTVSKDVKYTVAVCYW